ncbi:hypothetical protein [Effusibacillus lacus]|nr:hypothetical protein [Effusibacillus lacus]
MKNLGKEGLKLIRVELEGNLLDELRDDSYVKWGSRGEKATSWWLP